MRSYSNNLLFIVVVLTTLKVSWSPDCPFKGLSTDCCAECKVDALERCPKLVSK